MRRRTTRVMLEVLDDEFVQIDWSSHCHYRYQMKVKDLVSN
jgi:hypothetical protein